MNISYERRSYSNFLAASSFLFRVCSSIVLTESSLLCKSLIILFYSSIYSTILIIYSFLFCLNLLVEFLCFILLNYQIIYQYKKIAQKLTFSYFSNPLYWQNLKKMMPSDNLITVHSVSNSVNHFRIIWLIIEPDISFEYFILNW